MAASQEHKGRASHPKLIMGPSQQHPATNAPNSSLDHSSFATPSLHTLVPGSSNPTSNTQGTLGVISRQQAPTEPQEHHCRRALSTNCRQQGWGVEAHGLLNALQLLGHPNVHPWAEHHCSPMKQSSPASLTIPSPVTPWLLMELSSSMF